MEISPIGTLIALGFVLSVGGLLWWMLHPPIYVRTAIETIIKEKEMQGYIIVPMTGTP